MLDRADSLPLSGPTAAFPGWARAKKPPESEAEAAFLAGAALARLDALVRAEPPFAGVWRRRLALAAAAASVARAGRREGEAALRDGFHLTRPGADPGPAGRWLSAWRALATGSAGPWRSRILVAAEIMQVPDDEALRAAIEAAEACVAGDRLAPFAAARAHALARRALGGAGGGAGEGDLLSAALADGVLARKLNWPFVLPLFGEPLASAKGRSAGAETTLLLLNVARAAARAFDLAEDLGRRARGLAEAAPKLRAKGAAAALRALLDEDSLSAATTMPGLSERGARRLFDRLVSLGAVRELTGRPTFRLYGL